MIEWTEGGRGRVRDVVPHVHVASLQSTIQREIGVAAVKIGLQQEAIQSTPQGQVRQTERPPDQYF